MIYKAVIVDNSMLFIRGTVRVRIVGFFHANNFLNLEENFEEEIREEAARAEIKKNSQFSNDFEAILTSSIGGGRNYGSLYVPQINEKGVVAFLGSSRKNPVWLGGLFEAKRDDNFQVEYVNFPTDRFIEGENTDGVVSGTGNIGDDIESQEEKSFIIRTKHTSRNSQPEIDFQQQETSNIISVGKKRIRVTHFPEGSWEDGIPKKYNDILIGLTEESENVIKLLNKNEQNDTEFSFEINEDKGIINLLKDGEIKGSFEINEESVTLSNNNNQNKISLSYDSSIELINVNNSKITIKEDEIEVSNESNSKITAKGDEIEVSNDGGAKIILKSNGNIELIPGGEVHIVGGDDNLVKYSDLKEIIEEFQDHIHIAPTGPTSPALASNQAPIVSKVLSPSLNMKSQKGKVS